MSGTFMDGGGNGDSGGGQPMHSGGDSYVDGGGHDHHHGDGFMGGDGHDHQGASLASILGLSSQQQHNFIAHLLGLDHDTHVGLGGGQPSQIPYWAVAMQGLKVSHFFEGFSIQPSLWMLIMFSTFITWLFCISWIRHHEPIANAAIGTGAAMSASLDSHQVFSSAAIRTEMPPTMPDGSAPDQPAVAPIAPSSHLLQSARRPVLDISSLQSRVGPTRVLPAAATAPVPVPMQIALPAQGAPVEATPTVLHVQPEESLRSALRAAPVHPSTIADRRQAGVPLVPMSDQPFSAAPSMSDAPVVGVHVKTMTGPKLKMIVNR